jgi:hypothetical protein
MKLPEFDELVLLIDQVQDDDVAWAILSKLMTIKNEVSSLYNEFESILSYNEILKDELSGFKNKQ